MATTRSRATHRPTRPGLVRAAVAAVLAGALLVVGTGPAAAAEARDATRFACPPAEVASPFTDTTGNVHAFAIDCLFTYGMTRGQTATTYGPGGIVTRGQVATFLHHLLEHAGVPLDPADRGFTDVAGSVHEAHVNGIVSAGVARGTTATTFEPHRPVTRGQLAALVVNAVTITGAFTEIGPDAFDDDAGNVHETFIDAVAHNGIAVGVAERRFAPGAPVRRDAVASVLVRAVDFGVERGGIPSAFADNLRLAAMTPDQVSNGEGGEEDASGVGRVWTIGRPDVVCFEAMTRDVGSGTQDHPETGAYLAAGQPGEPGELLVELPPPTAANAIPFAAAHAAAAGCVRTTTGVVDQVVESPEGLFLGLATIDHTEALRGQLGVVEQELSAELTGTAEVPGPGDPDGTGHAVVTTTTQPGQLCWSIEVEGIDEVTAAHVHDGAAGVAGPPVVPLVPLPGDDGVVAWCAAGIDEEAIEAIAAAPAAHYVNVHTAAHPAGAVRGQLAP